MTLAAVLVGCTGSADPDHAATIGVTLDVAGTQRVTLQEAEVSVGGAGSRPPPEGYVYASFHFRVQSLSPDARYDPFRFSATDTDGRTYPYTAGGPQPALGSSRLLPTGEGVEGWISFEVPDDFDGLGVTYDPTFSATGQPITFVVRAPEPADDVSSGARRFLRERRMRFERGAGRARMLRETLQGLVAVHAARDEPHDAAGTGS